ncbi:DUF1648 domain-containing protein [Thermococcus sp.]
MNWKEFEITISLLLFFSSLLVLALRNRRNPLIGFRVGYTYHSERVWRKVNTFSGTAMLAVSLLLLGVSIKGVSINVFVPLSVSLLLGIVFAGLIMARREYELEEFSREAPNKPAGRKLETNIKPYILLQLAFLTFYLLLVVILWEGLPERVATHFSTSGPDSYGSKFWGVLGVPVLAWFLPFLLTLPAKDPGFFARANFYPKSLRGWCLFTTLLSLGLVLVFTSALLYNAGMISVKAINYSAYTTLGMVAVGTYFLLRDAYGGS